MQLKLVVGIIRPTSIWELDRPLSPILRPNLILQDVTYCSFWRHRAHFLLTVWDTVLSQDQYEHTWCRDSEGHSSHVNLLSVYLMKGDISSQITLSGERLRHYNWNQRTWSLASVKRIKFLTYAKFDVVTRQHEGKRVNERRAFRSPVGSSATFHNFGTI